MHIETITMTEAVSPVSPVGPKTDAPDAEVERIRAQSAGRQVGAPTDDWEEVEQLLHSIWDTLQAFRISLNFSRDDESGAIIVRLVEEDTGEMLRQIPSEAALKLSTAFGKLQGLIYNRQA